MFFRPLFLLFLLPFSAALFGDDRKVLLKDVTALTLKEGVYATGRRNSPIPQLTCRGHLCQYGVKAVQCMNVGFDGVDVQWRCEAPELPTTLKMENWQVSCEGFDSPNDPYILKGSCALEYVLTGYYDGNLRQDFPPQYEQPPPRYQQQPQYQQAVPQFKPNPAYEPGAASGAGDFIMILIVVGIALFLLKQFCGNNRRGGSGGGGGGGGGYGG